MNADTIITAGKDGFNSAIKIGKSVAKTSLKRMTKDLIFEFPFLISGGIETDEMFPMIKSSEKNQAAIVQTAISAEGVIDRDRYKNISEFLAKFHNNSDNPFRTYESWDTVEIRSSVAMEGNMSHDDVMSLWTCVEDEVDSTSINSMYLPYKRTEAKFTRAIESSIAVENANDLYFKRAVYKKNRDGEFIVDKSSGSNLIMSDKDGKPMYEYVKADPNDMQAMTAKYGDAKRMDEWEVMGGKAPKSMKMATTMIKDDKLNALTPTMIQMDLVGVSKSGGTSWTQQLVLGVKAMPHVIPSSLMVSNMVQAFKDRAIFTFIKWTKGERSLADILLNISESKALAKATGHSRWLKILKKRRAKANARFLGYKLNPNATIIITDAEAFAVKEQCGVDPRDPNAAKKMIDKYFLLAFGIYDTSSKMLSIMYDSDDDFSDYSLRVLMAETKKTTDLLSTSRY